MLGDGIGFFFLAYPFFPRMRGKKSEEKKVRERAKRVKNEKKRGKSEYLSDF